MAQTRPPRKPPPEEERTSGGGRRFVAPRRPAPAAPECDLDDAELVALAKQDLHQFVHLYRRYEAPVHRYCDRKLSDQEAAEDATSRTFLRAIEHLNECRDGSAFRSWLFAIAVRVVNDDYRARRPNRRGEPFERYEQVADGRPSPEDLAVAGEQRREISTLLSEFKSDEREVIALRLSGLNDREIAAALGRSHGTIRNKQSRIVKRLRGLLGIATGKEAGHVE